MIRAGGRGAMAAAIVLGLIAGEARAAGDCWSTQEISAARVRDLQSMLMVSALRCRTGGADVLASYNRFVAVNRSAIAGFNSTLKSYFTRTQGSVEGQRSYDRFTTALANSYGAGAGAGNCREMASLASEAASAGGSAVRLIAIAESLGLDPELPMRRCSMSIAAK